MSYTVLARKYRSQTLADIVGQEPIVTTLENAIKAQRVHHGYLFCGTRGVGKTSTARILAKSLNCLSSEQPTVTPCCECDACRAINDGEDIDVIEIDAASNTGVDNIRELRSNAAYRPARSRYKIYIIDEVHMLSPQAFNALLKTLEEPPEHVKFIFATTELHKVPATIQSRVQRFEFQTISIPAISDHLKHILECEGVKAEVSVLRRVSRLARGSLRDALSLLDQLLSLGSDRLSVAELNDVLPSSHDEQLAALITHISRQDAAEALRTLDQYLAHGHTLERFCEHLIEQLRTLMLVKICGSETELVDIITEDSVARSDAFDAASYVHMIALLEELRRQVQSSAAGRALIDAAVVRLTFREQFVSIPEMMDQLDDPAGPRPRESTPAPAQVPKVCTPPSSAGKSSPPALGGGVPTSVSSKEIKLLRKDPLVREALNLFEGTLINVGRAGAPIRRPATETGRKGS